MLGVSCRVLDSPDWSFVESLSVLLFYGLVFCSVDSTFADVMVVVIVRPGWQGHFLVPLEV